MAKSKRETHSYSNNIQKFDYYIHLSSKKSIDSAPLENVEQTKFLHVADIHWQNQNTRNPRVRMIFKESSLSVSGIENIDQWSVDGSSRSRQVSNSKQEGRKEGRVVGGCLRVAIIAGIVSAGQKWMGRDWASVYEPDKARSLARAMKRASEQTRQREKERERECVCVCVCRRARMKYYRSCRVGSRFIALASD